LLLTETPATATDRIFFEGDDVHERAPAEIRISWDKYNLTTSENAPIKISLWGYKETTIRPELLYIDMIEVSCMMMFLHIMLQSLKTISTISDKIRMRNENGKIKFNNVN
jgi:hypothetical protein